MVLAFFVVIERPSAAVRLSSQLSSDSSEELADEDELDDEEATV